jgi:thioredoxin reductase (NADPH)
MRIVNPSYGVNTAEGEVLDGKPLDWLADPIALFSNSKPNAHELMDGLKARLAADRPVDNIEFVSKPSASQPASADLIDEVAQKYRAALLALGD